MRSKYLVIVVVLVLLITFTATSVFAAGKDKDKDKGKKKDKDKKKGEDKAKGKKDSDKKKKPFLKPQNRRGFVIGPRLGVFLPMNSDVQENLSYMVHSGIDAKGFFIPWVGFHIGLGLMGGGDTGYVETTDGKKIDAYWATTVIPMNLGVTVEAFPKHVFDPYVGGGFGYYLVMNMEPMGGLPEDYEENNAPSDFNIGGIPGGYVFLGLDVKFHDYLGAKLEGSYHAIQGKEDLDNVDLSGFMISLGSWVYF